MFNDLVKAPKTITAAEHRSVPKQIEYWARIGKAVLENPELPLRMIQDTMLSLDEVKAGKVSVYPMHRKTSPNSVSCEAAQRQSPPAW